MFKFPTLQAICSHWQDYLVTTWVIAETLQVPMIEAEHSLFRAWSNHLTEDCRILLLKSILFNHWSEISKSHGMIVQLIGSARIETVVSEIPLPLAIALSLFHSALRFSH